MIIRALVEKIEAQRYGDRWNGSVSCIPSDTECRHMVEWESDWND